MRVALKEATSALEGVDDALAGAGEPSSEQARALDRALAGAGEARAKEALDVAGRRLAALRALLGSELLELDGT